MFEQLSNYFDERARAILKEGVAAWRRLEQHEDWKGWLRVGEAIATAQNIAASVTGQTSGRHFNAFMASCYAKPTYLGEFAGISKPARSYAVKCWRHREDIAAFRAGIGQAKALRLNHPQTVWLAFEASRRPASAVQAPITSPYEATKRKLAEAQAEIERLKKRPETPRTTVQHPKQGSTREVLLKDGLAAARKQIAQKNKEIEALTKLPTEIVPRYRAFCRRFRAQEKRRTKHTIAIIEERAREAAREARARSGAIPDRLWRDLMLCLHPDRSASDTVLARTFDEMREREKVLRAKAT